MKKFVEKKKTQKNNLRGYIIRFIEIFLNLKIIFSFFFFFFILNYFFLKVCIINLLFSKICFYK